MPTPSLYPDAPDVFSDPVPTTSLLDNTHSERHSHLGNAIEAVQATMGLNPQGLLASIAERLSQIDTRVYDIRTFGAVLGTVGAPQRTINLAALHDARDAVTAANGGTIYIPGILEVDGMCDFEDLGDTRITLAGDNGIFSGSTIRAHAAMTYLFSLKGTRRFVLRNILLDGNNLAEYGLFCARTGFPDTAGKHLFSYVCVFNCTKASHLNYASEENTYFKGQFQRSPIGAIFTAFPVVADPTVVDAEPVDFTATYQDSTANYAYDTAFGSAVAANPTTRCGLLSSGAQLHLFGAVIQTSPGAEAGAIIDSTFGSYSNFEGVQFDGFNPLIAMKIGKFSTDLANDSQRATRLIVKASTLCIATVGNGGTNFIEATDLRDSEIGPNYVLGALANGQGFVLDADCTDNIFHPNRFIDGQLVEIDESAVTPPTRNLIIGRGEISVDGSVVGKRHNLYVGPNNPNDMTATGTAFPSANAAILLAFTVQEKVSVDTAYLRVGVSSGNFDLGIYDDAGNRLTSTGSTAVPTAGQSVSVALGAEVTLYPGFRYYAAIACDNTTATFGAYGAAGAPIIPGYNLRGQIATSFPLPATISVPSNNSGLSYGLWFA